MGGRLDRRGVGVTALLIIAVWWAVLASFWLVVTPVAWLLSRLDRLGTRVR